MGLQKPTQNQVCTAAGEACYHRLLWLAAACSCTPSACVRLCLPAQPQQKIKTPDCYVSSTAAGMLRVFLTPGRGGYGISDQDCQEPGLYVVATSEEPKVSSACSLL
jgi:hypothetical protein